MDRRKKVSIQFEKLCSKKVTIKNINFKEKQFCSFLTEFGNHDYVKSLSEGLQKVKVREFVSFGRNTNLSFPFTDNFFPMHISYHSCMAFYSGKIKIKYHIKNHRDFEVDLYLRNCWGGSSTYPLVNYSFLEFKFYVNLLFEKISYYSKKKITFSVEIDFDLEGECWNERKNIEMNKESYFVAIYK